MYPRIVNDVGSGRGDCRPMFLRQLTSVGSSFLPRVRPALCRPAFRSSSASSSHLPHSTPAPPPWWPTRVFPSRPPRLPHPAAHQVFLGRGSHPRGIAPGNVVCGRLPFSTSAGLMMERPDREPPYKRRRSAEDLEQREGGAAGSKAKDGADSRPRPKHRSKARGRGRGRDGAGNRGGDVERTKAAKRAGQQTDGAGRQEASDHGRKKDSQPESTRTQTWNRGSKRFKEKQGGNKGPKGAGLPSSNPWQVGGAHSQAPPPGPCPPVALQQDGKPSKALQRRWEALPPCSNDTQPPGGGAAFDFSVMSYNILSQELLQDNAYLYQHCHPGVLPWARRLPTLLAEIQSYDADIMCLQEVQEDHYEDQIRPALQALGYQCVYKKRTRRKPDGCAVIFKTSRLSLLSSNPVEFFRPGDALLDRDNVGLVVLLQPGDAVGQSDPSAFICVANTHLLYNPHRGDIKLTQLAILLAEIGRLSRLPDGSANPVVLCGDFNSTPQSPLYSFLTTGCLKYKGLQSSMVSGQEKSPRGQRRLTSPLWSHSLGINNRCQYEKKPKSSRSPTVEGAISNLTVEDLATKAAAAASKRARIEHGLKLRSSYQHCLQPDGRPEITTCHSRTATTVDYILYTPEVTAPSAPPGGRGLQLLSRLSLVGESELVEVNRLPNEHHSSDHLPLLARFRFRHC